MVQLTTRVVGGVLDFVGIANAVAAITLPPKAPVSGPARAMLIATSTAVAALGLALATGRRWSMWPLIAAVAASMVTTLGVLTSGEDLSNIFTGDSRNLLVTYPMGLLSVATAYGFGLVVLLAEADSVGRRAPSSLGSRN